GRRTVATSWPPTRVANRWQGSAHHVVSGAHTRSSITPMTPSTAWKENIAADESAKLEGYAQKIAALQKRNHDGVARRALHAKSHGVLEASLAIADVPEHARHGMFARPATYEALVRFSNGAGKVQHDKVGDVRGIAVKVLGVPGKKVLGDGTT